MDLAGTIITATAVGLAAALPFTVQRAARRLGEPRPGLTAGAVVIASAMLVVSGTLAANGALGRFADAPPTVALLIVGLLVTTIATACSAIGGVIVRGTPLPAIIAFQAFRILAEIAIDAGHRQGIAPAQMTWHGRNLDILTGLSALPVAWLLQRRPSPRIALAWNLMGLALLVNVMVVGMLSLPAPWQRITPSNEWVTRFPYVWLPAVLVMAALFGHLLAFRSLISAASAHRGTHPPPQRSSAGR